MNGCEYYLSSSGSGYFSSVNIRNNETLATIKKIKLCESHDYYPFINSIKGCVDGVLLAHTILRECSKNNRENVIFLWNPTLRKVVVIPLYGPLKKTEDVTFGFGFDSVSNIYKVVALSLEKNVLKTMVYNLGSCSWISPKVKGCSIDNVQYLSRVSRSLNYEGCVYWLIQTTGNHETHYLCFNLSTEALTSSKLPDVKGDKMQVMFTSRRLAVLYESLALVDYSVGRLEHIRVWIKRRDGTISSIFTWVELYNIDCNGRFLYLTNNGNVYLESEAVNELTVSVYDMKSGEEKDCSITNDHIKFMDGYLESLAFLR
ncbi:F-box/kelch-repeat protein At3g06240-like [Silene latifolia]|uniref:F-box/kelch-repeat protein At3g06240-like n=1 Tax=Silene latifolia TaxID=37657 RepID=UPI003D7742A7